MSFERFNVLSAFENPEQADTLYVYEIVNYTGTREIMFKQNAVNHIFLKMCRKIKGVSFEHKKEVSLKSYNSEKEAYAINLKTTRRFASNDFVLKEILEHSNNYVFALDNWEENNSAELFLIAEADVDEEKLFAKEFKELDANPEQKLFSQYYELVLASYYDLIKNSGVIVNFLKAWHEDIKEIVEIEYELPPDTLLNKIDVFGDIYNEKTKEVMTNVLLPLEIKKTPNFLPVWCNLNSLQNPYEINIKNFKEDFQLDFEVARRICVEFETEGNQISTERIFEVYDVDLGLKESIKKELISLYKKLFIFSYLYKTNFKDFNYWKENQEFSTFFNNNFANKSAYDYNYLLVEEFKQKNKNIEKSKLFGVFKALCYASSEIIASPYMGDVENNKDFFRKSIWFYLVLDSFFINIRSIFIFNKNTSTTFDFSKDWEEYLKIDLSFASEYFYINDANNDILLKNKKIFELYKELPNKIENVKNESNYFYKKELDVFAEFRKNNYLVCIMNYDNVFNLIERFCKNNSLKEINRNIVRYSYGEPLKLEDWLAYLPLEYQKNYSDYLKIRDPILLRESELNKLVKCDISLQDYYQREIEIWKQEQAKKGRYFFDFFIKEWPRGRGRIHGNAPIHPVEEEWMCGIELIKKLNPYDLPTEGFIGGSLIPGSNTENWKKIIKLPKPTGKYRYYKNQALIKFLYKNKDDNKYVINLLDLITNEEEKTNIFKITFSLKNEYSKFGWKILNIKSDLFRCIWNSPNKLNLYVVLKNGEKNKKTLNLNYSFQKNNPTITITENYY